MQTRKWCALGTLMLLLFLAIPSAALAAGPADVVISTAYPWVVAQKGKTLTFPLEIANKGTSYQELDLQLSDSPADWKPIFKDGAYVIKKVIVAPGKSQTFNLQADPPVDAKANDYGFLIKALGADGSLVSDLKLKVSLQDKVGAGLQLSTQYPEIKGQAGTTFSFKMDAKNDALEDRPINFSAKTPDGWQVAFKPAYDTKEVNSIRVKAGETQGVDIDVKSPAKVEAGDYAITIQAAAGTERAEVPLKVTVLGNFRLELLPASGQLNTKATVDQDSSYTVIVKNTGASTLQNVQLSTTKPDGWQVTFNPEKIESIPPDQSRQAVAAIRPGPRTLAGDYMLSMMASGSGSSQSKDVRITVETPTTWGWAGIGAIVIVLGGLGLMFARLSRR